VYGGDIPQLYVNFPASAGEPPSVLKGFTHVELDKGQSRKVGIVLGRYDVSVWSTGEEDGARGWKRPAGDIGITVGKSSRDGVLKGVLPGSV
jgi:hypothetical protein